MNLNYAVLHCVYTMYGHAEVGFIFVLMIKKLRLPEYVCKWVI